MADCGRLVPSNVSDKLVVYLPGSAKYNVVVRGDGARSSVRVTVAFSGSVERARQCSSTGEFESRFESAVRAIAEGRSGP